MSNCEDVARVALKMEDFHLEDFNVVASCGHEVGLEEARAHRLSKGRRKPTACATCDMVERLGKLWFLELAAEHTVAVVEEMIGTEIDVLDELVRSLENQDPEGWKNSLYTILVSRHLNHGLYEFKHQNYHRGVAAIDEWERIWGHDWDLSACTVRYATSALGTTGAHFVSEAPSKVTVKVEVERRPGTTCTHKWYGLPDLGMPLTGTFYARYEHDIEDHAGMVVLTPIDE